MQMLPLFVVQSGEEAEIGSLCGSGNVRHRLQELGLVPGNRIRMVRGGSPCILLVNDETRLCLRSDEAESILVRPL